MMNRSSLARPRLHRYDRGLAAAGTVLVAGALAALVFVCASGLANLPVAGLLLGAVVALGAAVSIALGFAVAQAPSGR